MGIILTETFQKKYKKLDITLQNNFKEKLQLFITHGIQHPSLRIHKLKGKFYFSYSLSINMSYRALFYKKEEDFVFYSIGNHDIYK